MIKGRFKDISKQKNVISIILLLVYFVLFVISARSLLPEDPRSIPGRGDTRNYFMMSFNMVNYGTISRDMKIDENGDYVAPTPTAFREPGYPTILALGFLLDSRLRNLTGGDIISKSGEKLELPLRGLSYLEITLLFITSLISMVAAYSMTKNRFLALLVLFGVGLSPALMVYLKLLLAENFTALLILLLSFSFYSLIRKKSPTMHIVTGLLLGALTLTRAVFQYAWFPMTIFLCLHYFFKKIPLKRSGVMIFLFLVSYLIVVSPWIARNYVHFKNPVISDRGGNVLLVRAYHDMMTPKEYLASFVYWTPTRFTDKVLYRFFDYDEIRGLDLDKKNTFGYHVKAKNLIYDLNDKYDDHTKVNAILTKKALGIIKSHPFRHLALCLPFAWRGFFVEIDNRFLLPAAVISLLLFAGFFSFVILSLVKMEWKYMAFLLPSAYMFSIYVLVSHNIPRYQRPLIPVLWISSAIFIQFLFSKLSSRFIKKPNEIKSKHLNK